MYRIAIVLCKLCVCRFYFNYIFLKISQTYGLVFLFYFIKVERLCLCFFLYY